MSLRSKAYLGHKVADKPEGDFKIKPRVPLERVIGIFMTMGGAVIVKCFALDFVNYLCRERPTYIEGFGKGLIMMFMAGGWMTFVYGVGLLVGGAAFEKNFLPKNADLRRWPKSAINFLFICGVLPSICFWVWMDGQLAKLGYQ